jgi:ribosomal-protein-alanine N-acetyltransferase
MIEDSTGLIERVTVEPMTYWDLEQVASIERASFHRPWQPGGFRTELERKPARCLVVRDGATVLGYLIFWHIPPEIHILNIAIKPDFRGRGLAQLLLDYMFEYGRETGVEEVFLEVRPSNQEAQTLYQGAGFQITGCRKNYYSEDHEDAILMTRRL